MTGTTRAASLGIDIGGTFTDIVHLDHATGRQRAVKVLTTHVDPSRAVIEGARELLARHGLEAGRIARVVHATTLFTNALIERRGARTGLITTRGFRDTLEIGRERKYELYDIGIEPPAPLVPRDLRLEVAGRIMADGSERTPLAAAEVAAAARALVERDVASIAIGFLHAYANPSHEIAAAEVVAAVAPGVAITLSHEVAPEIREFERLSTAVANAYVKPLAARYIGALARDLTGIGIEAPLLLMLSNGGLTHAAEAMRVPVQLLESGPAAGALVAGYYGALEGESRLLAFDMGGTTAKLALVDDGQPLVAYAFEAARQRRFTEGSGLPIRISTVELIEIGAGGGSIARADEIGLLKVGPESAGSEPGPAAYGRGGTAATVTDANLQLSILNPETFAGGSIALDLAAGAGALDRLGGSLGLGRNALAAGIRDIVNESMTAAARVHIAERGRDPRNYAVLATGGGGPVHAADLARKLGATRVICPPAAGVASALGLIMAPARIDRVATIGFQPASDDLADLEQAFRRLETDALRLVSETGIGSDRARVARLADGRFVGQGFDLVIPLPEGPYDEGERDAQRARLVSAFESAYREKFARTPPSVAIEFISIRVSVTAPVLETPPSSFETNRTGQPLANEGRCRLVHFPGLSEPAETAILDRSRLHVGMCIQGPALIEEETSTLVVPPDATAEVRDSGTIIVTLA
ncbi:MAG: hydantoinase/oxoprolinase family protein [Hyphomicrobiaceae bacterium]|nr:hydantoinase/oxoprolinase family protein [Hyphomicrobiaceae bacterium]